MHHLIRDVMTRDPVTVSQDANLEEASRAMRQYDIGDVIVTDGGGRVTGILTDRDIVIRGVAEGRNLGTTRVKEICSAHVSWLAPDETTDRAVEMMRQHAVRRIPVVENDRPVGIVSLGDLARDREPRSVLGQVSSAPANK